MKRYLWIFLVCMLIAVGGAGCSYSDSANVNVSGQGKYSYNIYTVSQAGGLSYYEFLTDENEDKDALAESLIDAMKNVPEAFYQNSAFGDGVFIRSVEFAGSVAIVDFNEDFSDQSDAGKVLLRAAVVDTLTQIDGVKYVKFFVNGETLRDENGEDLGYQQASSYLSSASDENEALTGTVTLWFLNADKTTLVPYQETVTFASHSNIETAAMTALIEGPDSSDYNATLPDSVNLIGVQIREGVCYVNLGAQFVNDALDMDAYMPVDSIIRTMLELDGVEGVQIMINGNSDVVFKNIIRLDQVFTEPMNGYPDE